MSYLRTTYAVLSIEAFEPTEPTFVSSESWAKRFNMIACQKKPPSTLTASSTHSVKRSEASPANSWRFLHCRLQLPVECKTGIPDEAPLFVTFALSARFYCYWDVSKPTSQIILARRYNSNMMSPRHLAMLAAATIACTSCGRESADKSLTEKQPLQEYLGSVPSDKVPAQTRGT